MHIDSVCLKSFRNIEELKLNNICGGINIFIGDNAQGKTNLIEAVNYLSCAKSFRGAPDEALIQYEKQHAELSAEYTAEYYSGRIDASLYKNKRRAVLIGGIPIKRMTEMIGRINTVVFAPEDIRAIKDRPQQRRRLIDIEIAKIRPSYYSALQQYNIVLKSKSRLLKENAENALIEAYNVQLVKLAREIIENRRVFIESAGAIAADIHSDMSKNTEELRIVYRCCSEDGSEDALRKKAEMILPKEKLFRMCLFGPHREDIELYINGKNLRNSASQGQQRTAMISMKLAFAELAKRETRESPILLLDDVLSELDKDRRAKLFERVKNNQVFITATDIDRTESLKSADIYKVSDGRFYIYK